MGIESLVLWAATFAFHAKVNKSNGVSSNYNKMPQVIIDTAFSFLSAEEQARTSLVCKSWSKHKASTLILISAKMTIPTDWVLKRLGEHLRVVNLQTPNTSTFSAISQILPRLAELQNLTSFTMPYGSESYFHDRVGTLQAKAFFASSSLTTLRRDIEVSDEEWHPGFKGGFYRCLNHRVSQNLIDLTLVCSSRVGAVNLRLGQNICISMNLPQLQRLTLITDRYPDRVREFFDPDLITTYNRHNNLTHLRIWSCPDKCRLSCGSIPPIDVRELMQLKLPKLAELSLRCHSCTSFSEVPKLDKLRVGCPNIRELQISKN